MSTSILRLASLAALACAPLASHADDLLADGGFESSGSASISPLNGNYWSSDTPYYIDNPDRYDVVNGAPPSAANSGWRSDIGAEEGTHYLLVDGPSNATEALLRSTQKIAVLPSGSYTLSAYLANSNSNPVSVPNLTFQVDFIDALGNAVNQFRGQFSAPSYAQGWQQVSVTGFAGTGATQARISVFDNNLDAFGNDFAMDNLRFQGPQAAPEPSAFAALSLGALVFVRRRKRL